MLFKFMWREWIFIHNKYYKVPGGTINYSHIRTYSYPLVDFHLHENMYEIFFFISGNVDFLIGNQIYHLSYGDLLIMNSCELHRAIINQRMPYEKIDIHFSSDILSIFNCEHYNLSRCFTDKGNSTKNIIRLEENQISEIMNLFNKIESLDDTAEECCNTLSFAYFIELMVYINKIFQNPNSNKTKNSIKHKLLPIIDYINSNLDSNLSLETISNKFHLNKYYLSTLFKENTGCNLHDYITYNRINMAKELLLKDRNVTDTCMMCGFNDYSNFIRQFKKIVGVPPGQYRKNSFLSSRNIPLK